MPRLQAVIFAIVCALLGCTIIISPAHAGPCTVEIAQFEKAVRDFSRQSIRRIDGAANHRRADRPPADA